MAPELLKAELACEALLACGALRFRANGSSMLPGIRPGDVLLVHRRNICEVSAGEVAFYVCYGRLVAHRVISHDGEFLIAQGDSVPAPDPPIAVDDFLGVVVLIERGGRRITPSRRLRPAARMVAAVLSRSTFASKCLQRLYALFDQSRTDARYAGLPETL